MYEEHEEYMRRSAEQCYRLKYNEDKGCKEWDPRSPRESRECLWHLITPSDNSAPYWERWVIVILLKLRFLCKYLYFSEYFSGFSYHQYQVNQRVRSKDTGSRVFFTLQEDRPRQDWRAGSRVPRPIRATMQVIWRALLFTVRKNEVFERYAYFYMWICIYLDELSPDFSKWVDALIWMFGDLSSVAERMEDILRNAHQDTGVTDLFPLYSSTQACPRLQSYYDNVLRYDTPKENA